MYHIVVEREQQQMDLPEIQESDNDHLTVFKQPLDAECVEFTAGNPRVEHITGLVHLYKRDATPQGPLPAAAAAPASAAQASDASSAGAAAAAASDDVSTTVCCLAIPADMSVAQFCTFIGGYLSEVRSIQVLRRAASQPSVCMVLLSFAAQETADSFYQDFHGLPFSSLEPDIPCRLVFVRSVEVLSSRGRDSLTAPLGAEPSPAAAAAGSSKEQAAAAPAAAAAADSIKPGEGPAAADDRETGADASGAGSSSEANKPSTPKAKDSKTAAGATSGSSSSSAAGPGSAAAAASSGTQSQSYAAAAAGGALPAASGSFAAAAAAGSAAAAGGAAMAPLQQWLEPPAGTTELPTCPVCLERLDEHISGIVTTVCNHRFHGKCLKRWGDTSCPVCRYCMYSSNASTSRCSTCGTNANLWICLICGHVGCGRYKQGHANDHWQESAHCYSLELETQRVWDYAGDGYVHRLIQSKTDGKLVEVPSPAPTCSHSSPGHHHHHHHGSRHRAGGGSGRTQLGPAAQGSCSGGYGTPGGATAAGDDGCGSSSCPMCADEQQQMKDVLVSSKLDAITLEYNYLLTTQLDSQRQYFEARLAQQDTRQQQQLAAATAAAEAAAAAGREAAAAAKDSDKRRQQLERKLSELSASVSKVSEEREFLRSLNETLLANQKEFGAKLKAAEQALADKEALVVDLQEQVRDLMVFIEAQRAIQSEGGSELQEATLLPMPNKPSSSRRRGGGGRR